MTNNILIFKGETYRLISSGTNTPCNSCAFYDTHFPTAMPANTKDAGT